MTKPGYSSKAPAGLSSRKAGLRVSLAPAIGVA